MKLLFCHLMPYTDLPPDFPREHNSVWVDIDSRLFDPHKAHHMYHEFLDELEHAAEVGFDGICVNEHGAGHLADVDRPREAAEVVLEFLRSG